MTTMARLCAVTASSRSNPPNRRPPHLPRLKPQSLIPPAMKNSKTLSSKPARKSAAKPSTERGNMKPAEIRPLAIAARKAFDFQRSMGIIDDGANFDTWRRTQCMTAVGKEGISACDHKDFRPLLGHFQTLAGDDSAAFDSLMKGGKPTDHAEPGDDHETRRNLVFVIAGYLDAHTHLAEATKDQLLAEAIGEHSQYQEGLPWEGSASEAAFRKVLDRKACIAARDKGPIGVGYIVFLARQKTRRPDLTLGKDWRVGLADRCTVNQLTQIRDTLVNRINAVEGLGDPSKRNRKQSSPASKKARSPHELDDRRW